MDPLVKDLIQIAVWLGAAFGGAIAAYKAVVELRRANVEREESLSERRREYRWRQAEMARTILDEIWADPLARAAMKMLDWEGLTYTHDSKKTGRITHDAMEKSLRTADTEFTSDEQFVRDAFDQLFDGLERIEHYIRTELINWDDVKGRLEYYVGHLATRKSCFDVFLTEYGFALARNLLARFKAWQCPKPRP
jgi:hypothetical protein